LVPIHLHDVALLRREPGAELLRRERAEALAVEPRHQRDQILAAHKELGHRLADPVLERRLANRLAFVVFLAKGQPVASSWLATGGRYVDELNWWLPIADGELWLRDVFVVAGWRGRRLFSCIVDALAHHRGTTKVRIWSDVDWDNAASMRAHEAAGFQVVARVRALDLMGRLRIRSSLPSWPSPVEEIAPASRCIWLRGDSLSRHLQLLA
jgi:hypothetical protein